jgi:3-oxoacyl-[acyl-carrier protein] reductase
MINEKLLLNRVALVTGASRGIGRAIAISLAKLGVDIAVNYHSQKEKAEETAQEIREMGRKAKAIQADVSDSEQVWKLMHETAEKLGAVSILINNAAIAQKRSYEDITEDDWDQTIKINLKSVFMLTQAVLPSMLQSKWGRIVNISSGAAIMGGLVGPHYTASKAGIIGLTRYYASRLIKHGITVNAVAPALIDTDMIRRAEIKPDILPIRRFGTVEETAMAVELLVKNEFMTGQTISVNGGLYF